MFLLFLFFNLLVIRSGLFKLFFNKFFVLVSFIFNGNIFNYHSSFFAPFCFIYVFILSNFSFFPWGLNPLLTPSLLILFGISFFISSFILSLLINRYFLHLVEKKDGLLISLFFIVIHLLGDFIKPVSLCLRLFINLIVGHYILKFLFILFCSYFSSYLFFTIFILFELFVFMVQSYVFSYMLKLYIRD